MGELSSKFVLKEEKKAEGPQIGDALQGCSAEQYYKLKQSKVESERKFTDDLYDYKTLLELVLVADTKVTQSKRSSIHILDLLGEIGGF